MGHQVYKCPYANLAVGANERLEALEIAPEKEQAYAWTCKDGGTLGQNHCPLHHLGRWVTDQHVHATLTLRR